MTCLNCNLNFEPKNKQQKYCSAKCRTNNNIKKWRYIVKNTCQCGKPIMRESTFCTTCVHLTEKSKDMPLSEAIYLTHHKSSAFALIRTRARTIMMKNFDLKCVICNYSTHVEAAHIKPIASFPLDTLISVINSTSNIIPLCRNHHWEYDHDLCKLPNIEYPQ